MCLIKDGSPLRDHLDGCLEDHQSRHADIKDGHAIRIQRKLDKHAAKGLPPEKSPI